MNSDELRRERLYARARRRGESRASASGRLLSAVGRRLTGITPTGRFGRIVSEEPAGAARRLFELGGAPLISELPPLIAPPPARPARFEPASLESKAELRARLMAKDPTKARMMDILYGRGKWGADEWEKERAIRIGRSWALVPKGSLGYAAAKYINSPSSARFGTLPYVRGGESPEEGGWDCSGGITQCMELAGRLAPGVRHTSATLAGVGKPARPGERDVIRGRPDEHAWLSVAPVLLGEGAKEGRWIELDTSGPGPGRGFRAHVRRPRTDYEYSRRLAPDPTARISMPEETGGAPGASSAGGPVESWGLPAEDVYGPLDVFERPLYEDVDDVLYEPGMRPVFLPSVPSELYPLGDARPDPLYGLMPDFLRRVKALIDYVARRGRGRLTIASGYRSDEDQAVLYAFGTPNGVALPGESAHRTRRAADLKGTKSMLALAHRAAGRFGLVFPDPKGDPYHVEDRRTYYG